MTTQQPIRHRLETLQHKLEHGLVERRREVRLILLAALAGEHSLLLGPPGTAKSELARRLHRAFAEATYFERLLTRFSVPEELFGPLSIRALEEDRYERHIAGFLPEASIAFIDEVFKANSAILNALLTLLNEREFDNGAGRIHCPLISAIGASNEVPDDEVAAAFFDRFLLRIPVAPVSGDGFRALLALDPGPSDHIVYEEALGADERQALARAAAAVSLPPAEADRLVELREWLAAEAIPVSDRRWVKMAALLRTAAATEGRTAIRVWDLLLLPMCIGSDAASQAGVTDWLTSRLGVRVAFAPPRLQRVVAAFEGQLLAEQNADDLDYDDDGRLRMTDAQIAGEVNDMKGGSQALRMTYTRRRRFGATHIDARTGQIDDLITRIEGYGAELAATREDFRRYREGSLWLDECLAARVDDNLAATAAALGDFAARSSACRAGFAALPRLDGDPGKLPAPVDHEPLDA
ncbi:MAG: AAA family ATPase [Rhodocyclaceae bacterium]|nr:AAA family ATPase [Rhodocyclaceae bacterium]